MTDTAPQLYFDDFTPGQIFPGRRHTVDDRAFKLFAELTGDAHPIHYDEEYARASRFGGRVAHGLLLVAMTALGATLLSDQLVDSLIAFGRVEARFLKPVLVGAEVTSSLEVRSTRMLEDGKAGWVTFAAVLRDQDGTTVLSGEHEYLLKVRKP